MFRRRIGLVRIWLAFSGALLALSLATGYRASRAAGAPQYLLTKTRVLVDQPYAPADEEEARIEAAFADAGVPTRTLPQWRPMFVLGLDLSLPAVVASGAVLAAWTLVRRRIARRARFDVQLSRMQTREPNSH